MKRAIWEDSSVNECINIKVTIDSKPLFVNQCF